MTNRYYRAIELKKCVDCEGQFAVTTEDEMFGQSADKHPVCPACKWINAYWAHHELQQKN